MTLNRHLILPVEHALPPVTTVTLLVSVLVTLHLNYTESRITFTFILFTLSNIILSFQIETSEGSEGEPPLCAGCQIRITDKFYLCAVEKKWHSSCLKCAECGAELENEASCFEKDRNIYCRDDYLR